MNISARIYDELKFIARKREHAFNLYSIFLNVFESKVIKFWWIRSNNISELLFGGPNILEFSDSSKVINPGSVLQLSFWGYSVRNKNWFFIYILHYYAIICVTDYFWFSAKYLIEHCHTANYGRKYGCNATYLWKGDFWHNQIKTLPSFRSGGDFYLYST